MLDFARVSFLLSVLKSTVNILRARKVLCLACLVLCLNVTNYKAEAETVGFTDVFGDSTTASTRRAMPFDMLEDGTIESVSMYHEAGNPADDMILAVYDDNGNSPGSRIAITAETSISGSEGWQTITLITPVDVDFGEKIWLAWLYENNPGIRWRSGSPSRADSGEGWAGGMPTEFGSVSIGSTQYSIYATYTTGPPDTDPPTPNPATRLCWLTAKWVWSSLRRTMACISRGCTVLRLRLISFLLSTRVH